MHYSPGIQSNGDIIDINGKVISSTERNKILATVNSLPVNGYSSEIKDAVRDSIITVISAETGSGKTTQVPKMLIDDLNGQYNRLHLRPSNIVIAEPRVIATIGAANRVSQEKLSETGDPVYSIGQKIGYRTGREVNSSRQSELLFVTDGLQLLRQYVTDIVPDILVIDEVHTFSVSTEFLLSQVRDTLLNTNKKVKLVLMSATMDVEMVKHFFAPISKEIPVFDIPGRTFPVNKEYKNEYDFFPSIINFANQDMNILAFVEGKKEIEKTVENLKKQLPNYEILPLHSELPISEQNNVLIKGDKPRIIVATNVAQESITIDYINAVVDNGFSKILRVNDRGVPELHREAVSKADMLQRAGRAGRVQEGFYVRANDITIDELEEFPEGEIENITLEKYILIALSIGFNPLKYLKAGHNIFVHKPDKNLVSLSYENLRQIGAINKDNQVTKLGRELLNLPLDPTVGRMLKESLKRGCSGNMIDICAIINHKGFLSKIDTWKQFVKGSFKQHSDLISQRELFRLLTTRDSLSADLIYRLKQAGIDKTELNRFQQYSVKGKEKMLFEVVDFTSLGIKQKRLYEILNTINTLTERLQDGKYQIEYIEEKKSDNSNISKTHDGYDEICKCILAGMLNNVFVWNKKSKMFFNQKKGGFVQPMTSTITPSEKCFYVGNPFVIGGLGDDDDMPLLSFVTKIEESMVHEIGHTYMQEEFSDVTFGEKVVGKAKKGGRKLEPYIVANLQRDIGGVTFSRILEEIPKEKHREFIALIWLPDFLIENNVHFSSYVKSFKNSKKKFNIDHFKVIISMFTKDLQHRVYPEDKGKTMNGFAGDTSIFEDFENSKIPCVVEFRKNPCLESYTEKIEIPHFIGRREDDNRTIEFTNPKIQQKQESSEKEGAIHIIDHLHKKSKYSRNTVREFLEAKAIKINGIIATVNTYINPSDDIEIDFCEMEVIKAIKKQERINNDVLSEDDADTIRFKIEAKYYKRTGKKSSKKSVSEDLISNELETIKIPVTKPKVSKITSGTHSKPLPKSSRERISRKMKKKFDAKKEELFTVSKFLSNNSILNSKLALRYMAFSCIKIDGNIVKSNDLITESTDISKIEIDHETFRRLDKEGKEKRAADRDKNIKA